MSGNPRSRDDYTVAWISPLPVEQMAALWMFDERHEQLPQPLADPNYYELGSINGHNVVMLGLTRAGNVHTATVIAEMRSTFPSLRFGLLVGIGGGVPTKTNEGSIKLGHVVISWPTDDHSGAIQYDRGKAQVNQFERTGWLVNPPRVLQTAVLRFSSERKRANYDPIQENMRRMDTSNKNFVIYRKPDSKQDLLFESHYIHTNRDFSCQMLGCDTSQLVVRDPESSDGVGSEDDSIITVHSGTIASGESVMRDGEQRDRLAKKYGVLCFEMEAAGALENFPCLIVRGISDYADSHKTDGWQGYASLVAAAYARALFFHMPIVEVAQCKIPEKAVKQMIDDTRYVAETARETRMREWLKPPDAFVNYIQACKVRHAQTGSWFLDGGDYARWFKKMTRSLWLFGIPGSGKTVLASTVIHETKSLLAQENRPSLASPSILIYFFFDSNNSSKRTMEQMLRSLVFQMYRQSDVAKEHVDSQMNNSNAEHEEGSNFDIRNIFQDLLVRMPDTYVVLDALDECNQRPELLRWLRETADERCSILLTSRDEHDIASALSEWIAPEDRLSLTKSPVDEDIRRFVQGTIANDRELSRWKQQPQICAFIESKLMEKAGGMFRWAVCQLDSLKNCLDRKSLERALRILPDGLDETYARILRSTPTEYRPSAIRLLQFLLFSDRPLRLHEAVDAIAVDLEQEPYFDVIDRMPLPEEMIRYCGSLTRLVNVKESNGREATEIQLAHLSVREYLLSSRVDASLQSSFGESPAKSAIVQISLGYLFSASKMTWEIRRPKLPFLTFASKAWLDHARVAEGVDASAMEWIQRLFSDKSFFKYWANLFEPRSKSHPGTPLYFAALGGLAISARRLLEGNVDINAQQGFHGSALKAAVFRNRVDIVDLLLDRGADPRAKGPAWNDSLPLQSACGQGHLEVAKALLGRGVDINARSERTISALYIAARRGRLDAVKFLLDNGADVNLESYDSSRSFALGAAATSGRMDLVKLLLSRGANVNARSKKPEARTALELAAAAGHMEIVKLLLNNGARSTFQADDIESTASDELPPDKRDIALAEAVSNRQIEILKLLLDKGADINALNAENESLLCIASRDDAWLAIAKLLIERDIDTMYFDRALQSACRHGSVEIAKLLLSKAQISACIAVYIREPNDKSLPAFYGKGKEGHVNSTMLKLLVDKGLSKQCYLPALSTASEYQYRKSVKFLLSRGAHVGYDASQSRYLQEALNHVASKSRPGMVRLFMDRGIDKNFFDHALRAANKAQNKDVVRFLIESGAMLPAPVSRPNASPTPTAKDVAPSRAGRSRSRGQGKEGTTEVADESGYTLSRTPTFLNV